MENKNRQQGGDKRELHPGSSKADAKAVGGKNDFGAREGDVVERSYVSRNTKKSDPGAAVPHAGVDESRIAGVGGNLSGTGSSSGGDLDTDIVGVGTGRGMATSGKIHEPAGPDDTTGTSREFASGPPAEGKQPSPQNRKVRGSTVQLPDERTAGPGGSDASPNPDVGNAAAAGEVSSDEASGRNDAGD